MIRDLIKWVAPGLATVLGGTTLCLAMTSADIADDLASRSTAAMAAGGYDWAVLSLDGRDLTLTGTTTDQALLDSALARLSSLDGIRSVTDEVTLAPVARPYALHASIDQGIVNLSGGVPNDTARQRLLTLAGLEQGALDLRSGVPDRRSWVAGAEFAVDQLRYFDQGEAVVSDMTVSLNGRAKSERAFRDLRIVLRAGAPAGLTLGDVKITPALVSPYEWSASFDGKRIEISGHVPDDAYTERFRTADVSGAQLAIGLALASGEPADFAEISQQLLEQLARLEYGTASISDDQSTLSGAPATLEIAQGIVDTLEPSGTIVVLEPPRIEDYWMSATRQPGGVVVFDGYAPDEATRQAFSEREGADTSYLKLGRGAPERYQSGVDFGLDALELMNEGRIALRDNVLTIVGAARSGADYERLLAMMAEPAPQGLVLARAETLAPRAESYTWSATRDEGAITLSGMVPNAADEAELLAMAGPDTTETMTYASGEPNGFLASAKTALGLLQRLSEGSIVYDGAGWTMTGTASSAADKTAIEADFVARQLASAGWSMALADPPPVVREAEPAAQPDPEPEPAPAPAVTAEPQVEPETAPEAAAEPEPETPAQPEPEPETAAQPEPEPEPEPALPAPPAADDISACADPVAEFSARNSILFQSGAALIAAESEPALDELALDLAACPDAIVHIEGHTDADGDEGLNLALSVARAEAVVAALVSRGVSPARLYAVGYGETAPISNNDTAEGKRLNRRIVVTVQPESP